LFPMKCFFSVNINKKSKTRWQISKTLSCSSPNNCLPHQTTFSKTQTGATVPCTQIILADVLLPTCSYQSSPRASTSSIYVFLLEKRSEIGLFFWSALTCELPT
jgi:hypothetical protein